MHIIDNNIITSMYSGIELRLLLLPVLNPWLFILMAFFTLHTFFSCNENCVHIKYENIWAGMHLDIMLLNFYGYLLHVKRMQCGHLDSLSSKGSPHLLVLITSLHPCWMSSCRESGYWRWCFPLGCYNKLLFWCFDLKHWKSPKECVRTPKDSFPFAVQWRKYS